MFYEIKREERTIARSARLEYILTAGQNSRKLKEKANKIPMVDTRKVCLFIFECAKR